MSDAPVDRLRELYGRWAQGDFSTTGHLLSPDVEWHQAPGAIEAGVRHGHDGAERIVRGVFETFDDFRVVASEFIDRGRKVVVVGRVQGWARISGLPVDRVMSAVWTFDGDLAVRLEWYSSREEALAASEP